MRHTVLSSVASLAPPYFSTLSHKRHDFREKKSYWKNDTCVLIFSTTFIWYISHSKKNSARYCHKRWKRLRVKYHSYSCRNFMKLEIFSTVFRKKGLRYQSYVQWEPSCTMRTEGRTDVTKLTVAFRNVANAPKNQSFSCVPNKPTPHRRHMWHYSASCLNFNVTNCQPHAQSPSSSPV
jgi:hypothetical protein